MKLHHLETEENALKKRRDQILMRKLLFDQVAFVKGKQQTEKNNDRNMAQEVWRRAEEGRKKDEKKQADKRLMLQKMNYYRQDQMMGKKKNQDDYKSQLADF